MSRPMAKHTAGPWKETGNWYLESTGDLITFTAITAITPYRKVAAVITDTREIENWDEMRANAKLIATAPELLEALEKTLETLECMPCRFFACDGPDEPFVDMSTCYVCALQIELKELVKSIK